LRYTIFNKSRFLIFSDTDQNQIYMKYEYNTQRGQLILPEYGRNVQKLAEYCMTIEDRNERNKCAQAIVNVMSNLNPHYRENSDVKHKLWDHLAIISNFKLDVDYPFEIVKPETLKERPKKVAYSKNSIKLKHYGRIVELFIKEAVETNDQQERDYLIRMIANHMKRLYLTYNNDEIINDEQIFKDLEELSEHRLTVDRSIKLTDCRDIVVKPKKKYQKEHHHRHFDRRNHK